MRRETTFRRRVLFAMLQCVSSAAIAQTSLSPDLSSLPWGQIGLGIVLSLWGGLTRTSQRMRDNARAEKPLLMLWRDELPKDLLVSSGVGFLIYSFGGHQQWEPWLLGGALWIGGYLGAVVLNTIGAKALEWLRVKNSV